MRSYGTLHSFVRFDPIHTVLLKDGANEVLQAETSPPPGPRHGLGAFIKEHSRTAYAMPAEDIERYIREWYEQDNDLPHIRINS